MTIKIADSLQKVSEFLDVDNSESVDSRVKDTGRNRCNAVACRL